MAERDLRLVALLVQDLVELDVPPWKIAYELWCVQQENGQRLSLDEFVNMGQAAIRSVAMHEVRVRGELGGD